MENLIEITSETQEKVKQAENMLEIYKGYKVMSNEQYIHATEDLRKIKAKADELDTLRKSMTKPLDESKKKIMDFFKKPLDFLSQAEASIKRAILSFQQEMERKRQEEERKLQELARKEEEKKRKALEERAKKAEEKGNIEKAEELREQKEEVYIPAPIVQSQVEKINGISTKKIWKFRIVDESLIPREYLIPNEKMLGEVARATKGTLKVSGIEFYSEDTIASGR